jgi:hypothetical protein
MLVAACLVVGGTGGPARAAGSDPDDQARKSEREALDLYLNLHFFAAERALREAIHMCDVGARVRSLPAVGRVDVISCSRRVEAHLHLSLGFVYGAGERALDRAREEFVRALGIDRTIRLEPQMSSRELSEVFRQAAIAEPPKRSASAPDAGSERPIPPDAVDVLGNRSGEAAAEASGPAQEPPRAIGGDSWRHSLSLFAEGDLAVLSATNQVCTPGTAPADWTCFDASGNRYSGIPQRNMDNNNARAGLVPSTLRLVAGYDYRVGEALSLGARLGFAFPGGRTPLGGAAFLPLHAEARVTYGAAPRPLAPLMFLSVGLMEVDTHVSVVVVEVPCSIDYSPRCARKLDAWRRVGYGFAGAGGGVRYAVGGRSALTADLRLSMTFVTFGFVVTPEVGYGISF